jgi:hypothetical protein
MTEKNTKTNLKFSARRSRQDRYQGNSNNRTGALSTRNYFAPLASEADAQESEPMNWAFETLAWVTFILAAAAHSQTCIALLAQICVQLNTYLNIYKLILHINTRIDRYILCNGSALQRRVGSDYQKKLNLTTSGLRLATLYTCKLCSIILAVARKLVTQASVCYGTQTTTKKEEPIWANTFIDTLKACANKNSGLTTCTHLCGVQTEEGTTATNATTAHTQQQKHVEKKSKSPTISHYIQFILQYIRLRARRAQAIWLVLVVLSCVVLPTKARYHLIQTANTYSNNTTNDITTT